MADVQDPNSHAYPNEGALIIPVTRADLGRFIGGLLGQPQTIEDSFSGPFDLQKHDLVDQRIRQQNRGELIQFTVRVVYDDDSTILLNGLEDFRHYHEVRPRISVEAHLSWTYLIQFEDKQTPEKQNIEVIISTKAVIRDIPRNLILKIQHTGRTWGFDIEHLLSGQIKSWIYHEHAFKQLIYRYRGRIGLTFAILFMILIGTYLDFIETDFQNMQRMAAQQVLAKSLDEKVGSLVTLISEGKRAAFDAWMAFCGAGSFILALILGAIITGTANNPPRSYLVLSDAAKVAREQSLKSRKRTWGYFLASGITAIVAGILSRYLFLVIFGQYIP